MQEFRISSSRLASSYETFQASDTQFHMAAVVHMMISLLTSPDSHIMAAVVHMMISLLTSPDSHIMAAVVHMMISLLVSPDSHIMAAVVASTTPSMWCNPLYAGS